MSLRHLCEHNFNYKSKLRIKRRKVNSLFPGRLTPDAVSGDIDASKAMRHAARNRSMRAAVVAATAKT